ncbi:MAG: hypothetical protein ACREBR_05525 [bacterium]
MSYSQIYRKNNKERFRKLRKKWIDEHKEDVNFKLSVRLRHRLYEAIKGDYKSGSAVRDLGCSIDFLKQYIESKFQSGMSWDNWGEVWELDHIRELSTFDLTDSNQLKQAVNYTNLQPLTIEVHKQKTAQSRRKS